MSSYVEYILAQSSKDYMALVCRKYKTKSKLIEAAYEGFNECKDILDQNLLIRAVMQITGRYGYIIPRELDDDGKKLYNRCNHKLFELKMMDARGEQNHEFMFNFLVDVNWLFVSKYICDGKIKDSIPLIISETKIQTTIRKACSDVLYDGALYYKERSEQYAEAKKWRYQFFPWLHSDAEIRQELKDKATPIEFEKAKKKMREGSIYMMALYYALTATAERVEEIRRMR